MNSIKWVQACEEGNLANVIAYYDPNFHRDTLQHAFCEITSRGYLHLVKHFIEKFNFNPHGFYYDNDAPLCYACQYNRLDIIQYLISKGCTTDCCAYILFRCSIGKGYIDILKYIYHNDGFPDTRKQNRTFNAIDADSMYFAMKNGHWSCVIYTHFHFALRNLPFPVEKTPCGRTGPEPIYSPMPSFQSFQTYRNCILILSLGYSNSVTNEFTRDPTWDNNCMKIVALFAF